VPANPELYRDDQSGTYESVRPARPPAPSASFSDRPTYVPEEYAEPRLESPPSVTIDETDADTEAHGMTSRTETLAPAPPRLSAPRAPAPARPAAPPHAAPAPLIAEAPLDSQDLIATDRPPAMPPPLITTPGAPAAPTVFVTQDATIPPRARGPRAWSRILFVVLFGGVGSLLGYAFRPELAHALVKLGDAAHRTTSVK
jgi:hypothetical protein